MMRKRRLLALASLAFVGLACGLPSPGVPGASSDTITRDQMIQVNASTVYDAVQKLQPGWLSSRGPTSITDSTPTSASVFLNGNLVGDIEYLRGLRPDDVERLRYYEPGEAGARFGMGHQRGVIEVISRGGKS